MQFDGPGTSYHFQVLAFIWGTSHGDGSAKPAVENVDRIYGERYLIEPHAEKGRGQGICHGRRCHWSKRSWG